MHTHSESSAVGSALRSGRRGRAFESPLSDTSGSRNISAAAFRYACLAAGHGRNPSGQDRSQVWEKVSRGVRTWAGRRARTAAGDFNTICFRAKNVLSLQCESAGAVRNRPFFVSLSPFQGETAPMTGKTTWHVRTTTSHVVFFVSACRKNYKPCTRAGKCRKVKNVNVQSSVSSGRAPERPSR